MTNERRIYEEIKAEMEAADAAYEAAREALNEYEMNPANWHQPDYQDCWSALYKAIGDAAAKTREIGARLDAAEKELPEYRAMVAPYEMLLRAIMGN